MKTNRLFSLLILLGCALFAGCNPDDPKAQNLEPNKMIFYTTSDRAPINLNHTWGGNLIYHDYEDGIGLLIFNTPITGIPENAFDGCDNLTTMTIPDGVTSIGRSAFSACDGLTNITIPNSVTSFGRGAFDCCTSLTSITIPDSVTSIDEYTFFGCGSLRSITIPDGVTSIGSHAFGICSSLTSVTIPDSVTSIGDCAFRDCTGLTSVYCMPITPPTGRSEMFDYNASDRKIYVPSASVNAYKAAKYWSNYADAIVGYDFSK